jgi:hypothetical protein
MWTSTDHPLLRSRSTDPRIPVRSRRTGTPVEERQLRHVGGSQGPQLELFAPAWRDRTAEEDPGAPFFNDTEKFAVGAHQPAQTWASSTRLGAYDIQQLQTF